jgi:hypothetical protein
MSLELCRTIEGRPARLGARHDRGGSLDGDFLDARESDPG